ncbi:MAG: AmmeMemoRadiSam system protein B [Deltaproteobacteria bacterium]|nr:MAG: AmmeMemoRadiSam system protein B [Deltaproteobacteria bacterium]
MDGENPRARKDLDFFPAQTADRTLIMIKDRLGLVEEGRAIGAELYKVIALLDGYHSLRDIQIELMRQQGGQLVSMEEIETLLNQLDTSYLLDSPRYREAKKEIISRFTAQQVRHCSHAGLSYPEQEEELRRRLESILTIQDVPELPRGKITALVAPHIDLEAGKRVYSSAYQAIRGVKLERVILLGVGHSMTDAMFSLTAKTFETPLGKVEVDQESVKELMKAGNDMLSIDDFAHRDEHSIEFQLIFLQQILRDSAFTIVPVLCGSLMGSLPAYSRKEYRSKAGDFLGILAEAAEDENTILVAGVDFSHIGPKFGHDMPASHMIGESEKHDRQLLDFLCTGNADGFWEESEKVQDRYNVCGFSALACLLETIPPSQGTLLAYETYREEPTKSAVSFTAAIFTSPIP